MNPDLPGVICFVYVYARFITFYSADTVKCYAHTQLCVVKLLAYLIYRFKKKWFRLIVIAKWARVNWMEDCPVNSSGQSLSPLTKVCWIIQFFNKGHSNKDHSETWMGITSSCSKLACHGWKHNNVNYIFFFSLWSPSSAKCSRWQRIWHWHCTALMMLMHANFFFFFFFSCCRFFGLC